MLKETNAVIWTILNILSADTRVVQEVLGLTKKGWHNPDSFSLSYNIPEVTHNTNTLGPAMFMQCNPLMKDACTLVPQALLHDTDFF